MAAAAPDPVYLVGGAVRDLLLGRGRADIDLAVEGDPAALAAALGAEPLATHSRFGTMKVDWNGEELDLAAARRESYPRPGALPIVELGAPIRTDLARRDFTVNAMAIPLADPTDLLDPYDGQVDLRGGLLRVIHDRSFLDDPTRAIRAARYATRFGFALEAGTRDLLRAADLTTVTPERRAEELRRLAAEERGVRGLELLAGWGLVEPRPGGESFALARDVDRLLAADPWAGEVDRPDAILVAAGVLEPPDPRHRPSRSSARPRSPPRTRPVRRRARRWRAGVDPLVLVLARAMGAAWLDDWLEWRGSHSRSAAPT